MRSAARVAGAAMLAAALGATAAREPAAVAGPFEIETVEKRIGAGGFPNTSGNPFARTTVTVFRVKHRGRRLAIPDARASFDEFWEAKVLEGAPRPALLLMLTGAYLVTEEQGQVRIDVLAPASSNIGTWQWLDLGAGQPGPEHAAGIRNATGESRIERGGRLLRVGRQAVVDVATLAVHRVSVNSSENLARLERYYGAGDPARALSPGRSQFVIAASRDAAAGGYEYALVAVEFATGRVYAVPFDRNALRFESVHDATPEWIVRNFEWTRDPGGAERLRLHVGGKPAPWLGRLVRFGGGMVDYRLQPTREGMFDVLYAFIQRDFGGTPGPSPQRLGEGPRSKVLFVEGSALRVHYFENERSTALYHERTGSSTAGYALVERIGRRFDAELAAGHHQALFADFPK